MSKHAGIFIITCYIILHNEHGS